MENDQQSHADSEANHHAPPKPVACHPCLIFFSHERSLLRPCRRGKGKCPTPATVPVSHCVPRALGTQWLTGTVAGVGHLPFPLRQGRNRLRSWLKKIRHG